MRCNQWFLCFILIVTGLFSPQAFALYSDCTAPVPISVSLPAVSVPTNLAVGEIIPGAKASFGFSITCTYTFNGSVHWYATLNSSATAKLVTGFTDVYTTAGMGAGVGFRIRNTAGSVMVPISYSGAVGSFDFGVALNHVSPIAGSFELVKTAATMDVGTFSFGSYLNAPSTEYANGGNATKSALSFDYTISPVTVAACKVLGADIAVPLQTVRVSELATVGATAYPTSFGIDLNCEGGAKPQISLADVANPGNVTTELSLAPGSTATGIAIQLLSGGVLVKYAPAPYYYTGTGPAVNNSIVLGTMSGVIHVPFVARYIRVGQVLTPGTVIGKATFTFTYQ